MIPARLSDNGAGEISAPLLFVTGDLQDGAGRRSERGSGAIACCWHSSGGAPGSPPRLVLWLSFGCRPVAWRPGGRAPPGALSGPWPFGVERVVVCVAPALIASGLRLSALGDLVGRRVVCVGGVVRRPPRIAWVAPRCAARLAPFPSPLPGAFGWPPSAPDDAAPGAGPPRRLPGQLARTI